MLNTISAIAIAMLVNCDGLCAVNKDKLCTYTNDTVVCETSAGIRAKIQSSVVDFSRAVCTISPADIVTCTNAFVPIPEGEPVRVKVRIDLRKQQAEFK